MGSRAWERAWHEGGGRKVGGRRGQEKGWGGVARGLCVLKTRRAQRRVADGYAKAHVGHIQKDVEWRRYSPQLEFSKCGRECVLSGPVWIRSVLAPT